MISLHGPQLTLLVGSAVSIALAMVLIARGRSPRAWEQRWGMVGGAGFVGFGSGACLGALGGWGRPIRVLLFSAVVLGVVMGLATAGMCYQVLGLSHRQRKSTGIRGKGLDTPRTDD